MPALVKALNKVDLPTLGKPTIPHFKDMSIPVGEAGKCMRWPAWAWVVGLLLLLACAPTAAQPLAVPDRVGRLDLQGQLPVWIDPAGTAGILEVSSPAGRERFQPASREAIYQLGPNAALWMRLELQRGRNDRQEWLLEFPMPVLDLVTVFQREPAQWRAESAGDTVAVNRWPEGGRYPFFRLDVPPGEAREVFLRIRHTTAADFPLRLTTAAAAARHTQFEYLALGVAVGALLLLVAACLAQSWVYRDAIFAWYAVYAAVTALAVAAYTGAAAHLLWPAFGGLADAPMSMLAAGSAGAAMLFVRNLAGLRRRYQRLDRLLLAMGVLGLLLAALPPFVPKTVALPLIGAYMALATLFTLGVGGLTWLQGDLVGKWICAAYLPMTLSVIASFLRIFGWLPVSVGSQYGVVAAMAIEVPLLLVALSIRSRDRHSAEIREQALSTHDALTGLFQDRLRQVVARYKREGESAAVMFIDLVNHGRIKENFGTAVAEQSLLRSVIKLRRLLRDVDTAARLGERRFAVILEGASARISVTERAARLIAAGLMPLPGLKPDVTLQFHVAALLLNERCLEAEELQEALHEQLARMSPRTRRPIRFIVPGGAEGPETVQESSLFAADADRLRSRPPLSAVT
jgi:diguanylate cyclase (GGDEF)-like protein